MSRKKISEVANDIESIATDLDGILGNLEEITASLVRLVALAETAMSVATIPARIVNKILGE